MQNPLLNDYVKKHNRGWANAMQVLGREVGEVVAFILIYEGIHKDPKNQQYIFYGMTGVVLVAGLLITIFMVKDKKPKRDYVKDEQTGEVMRHATKVAEDEDPNDTGSDIDLYIPETVAFFKGVSLNCWGKTKLLVQQTYRAIRSDLMTQFILYGFFVNAMMQAKVSTIIYIWLQKWVVNSESDKVKDTDMVWEESWDIYQLFKIINFACSAILLPLFGLISDKIAMGHELMATFGLRAVGTMAYFLMDSPHGAIVIFTFIMISMAASLQGVVMDSLYSKRLPGDVRA